MDVATFCLAVDHITSHLDRQQHKILGKPIWITTNRLQQSNVLPFEVIDIRVASRRPFRGLAIDGSSVWPYFEGGSLAIVAQTSCARKVFDHWIRRTMIVDFYQVGTQSPETPYRSRWQ